jgi:hypothetical protein
MTSNRTQISVKGRQIEVPLVQVDGFDIVTTGRWLKMAAVQSEDYAEKDPSINPERLITGLKNQNIKADIFSIAQRIPDISVRHPYPMQWDNVAAIPIRDYSSWWNSLSQETRRNVRLATKRGVSVQAANFSDNLVRGIADIYNEIPVRQGRRFWHYGKDFDTVKRENASYLDRSQFIAAYCGAELAGFIKMVFVGKYASIMQILSKEKHRDKRLTNALVAKAVELCAQKGASHLLYCKYVYHKNYQDALTEFKRRNGFEQILVPRYYVPLTLKGHLAVRLKLQLGLSELLPQSLVVALLKARAWHYERKTMNRTPDNSVLNQHEALQ